MKGMKSVPEARMVCMEPRAGGPIGHPPLPKKLPDWVQTSADFCETAPEPEQLVSGVLQKGELLVLQGEPGGGKSWTALEIAIAVATGRRAFGHLPVQRGRVLIIEEEGLAGDLKKRIDALEGRCEDFLVAFRKDIYLDDPEWVTEIKKLVVECEIALVIGDPLADLHNCDEDRASSMKAIKDFVKAIQSASPKTAIIFVSHVTKDAYGSRRGSLKHGRGSGRIAGDADVIVECLKGKSGDDEVIEMTLETVKRKSGIAMPPMRLSLDLRHAAWTVNTEKRVDATRQTSDSLITPQISASQKVKMQILRLLQEEGPIPSKNAGLERIKVGRQAFYHAFNDLLRDGKILEGAHGFTLADVPENKPEQGRTVPSGFTPLRGETGNGQDGPERPG